MEQNFSLKLFATNKKLLKYLITKNYNHPKILWRVVANPSTLKPTNLNRSETSEESS
jgi:hypothetical protein